MSRRDIYYWKCDRPAAFHGTEARTDGETNADLEASLRDALRRHFSTDAVSLAPGAGQGNHLTWNAEVDGASLFVRVENGPERDGQLTVESAVLDRVGALGVPVPKVWGVDASRTRVSFAWQALERLPWPDLNHWQKQGRLDTARIAFEIGAAVAAWQAMRPGGYGPLDAEAWEKESQWRGFHAAYGDYFWLRLESHLRFLVERNFLSLDQCREIEQTIAAHHELLCLDGGCLVHKDLALWNSLGSENHIAAFIDFDDAVSGDPMDDLSLLACFHDAAFLGRAFEGYQSARPLPDESLRRFWLHLLRNMLVKAVIRVGAGYFERTDGFFLIGAGSSGADLRRFTLERIAMALQGLRSNADLSLL